MEEASTPAAPLDSSLRTFAIAALRLALDFVENVKSLDSLPDREAMLSILTRQDWRDFATRSCPTGEKMHVAFIPDEALQGTFGRLVEMFGIETMGPARQVLVGLLEEPEEASKSAI